MVVLRKLKILCGIALSNLLLLANLSYAADDSYILTAVNGGAEIAQAPANDGSKNGIHDTDYPSVAEVPAFAMKSVKSAIGKAADGAANIYLLYFSKHAGNKIFVKWSGLNVAVLAF